MLLKQKMLHQLEYAGNGIGLLIVITVLISASILQFTGSVLPCPLCLLQRIGFIGIGIGFLFNLHFGISFKNYAIVIISALYTAATALRQMALHLLPGTGAYGDPILGLHLYTWSFITAVCFIAGIALLLIIHEPTFKKISTKKWRTLILILTLIFALIILTDAILVFLECGLKACPDNPTNYLIIEKITN